MNFLDFYNGFKECEHDNKYVLFEYRLACSGEIFNSNVTTFDHRKSTHSRLILLEPFSLFVCSQPFNEYPQELCLRFSVPLITQKYEKGVSSFYPDDDIADEIAALLSLFCRRLITLTCKTREEHTGEMEKYPEPIKNFPVNFTNALNVSAWPQKRCVMITKPEGVEIEDYNPSVKGIDPEALSDYLTIISKHEYADSIIFAIKLYHLALQKIESEPDISYLLLIACIETIASDAIDYEPSEKEMCELKGSLKKLALEYKLSENQAIQLVNEACKGINWHTKKFVGFILQYVDESLWKEDDLFRTPEILLPKKSDNIEKVIKDIYHARGKMQHKGRLFPDSAKLGSGPMIPAKIAYSCLLAGEKFPPVTWFERVVNITIMNYLLNEKKGADPT